MKIVRMKSGDDISYGVADAEGVIVYHGSPLFAWEPTENVVPWRSVTLLAPVIPTKVVGVGRNYEDHAAEFNGEVSDEPIVFMKPATSVIGPDAHVVHPTISNEVHHEAELAVVISRPARHVKAEDASRYIFGYTAANDVTARDLQRKDGQWTRAKGFDTFCPLGPAIATDVDAGNLAIKARLNGKTVQDSNTNDLIFDVPALIRHISAVMTLEPGDVIITGTPAGVGPITAGDVVDIEIEGIGVLSNPVVLAE